MAPITRRGAAAKAANGSQHATSTQKLPTAFKASKSNGISKGRRSKKGEAGKKGAARKLAKALEEGIDDSAPTPSSACPIALPSEAAAQEHPVSSIPASSIATNAPLTLSPETEAVVAYVSTDDQALPGAPKLPTHKRDILKQAHMHLVKHAPKLAPLIEEHTCTLFTDEGLAEVVDPFQSLASGIISQQVSGAAARSIKAKFVALFSVELEKEELTFPTPSMALTRDHDTLRSAGLSVRKAEYIHSLAEAFTSGDVTPEFLATANDQEIVDRLTAIRGIGVWSAEMFLMFGLRRMDVFSTGDLGIQRGMAAFVGKDVKSLKTGGKGKWKYMSEAEMLKHSEPFRPYRTLFCWYMWRCEGTMVEAMSGETATKRKAKATKKAIK